MPEVHPSCQGATHQAGGGVTCRWVEEEQGMEEEQTLLSRTEIIEEITQDISRRSRMHLGAILVHYRQEYHGITRTKTKLLK